MSLIAVFGVLLLVGLIKSVSVKSNPTATLLFEDKVQYNLTELFSNMGPNLNCSVPKDNKAKLFFPGGPDKGTFFAHKDFGDHYNFTDRPTAAGMLTNSSFYAVYDNHYLVIQNVSLDGQTFGATVVKPIVIMGDRYQCFDAIYNEELNQIYVGCMTEYSPNSNTTGHFTVAAYDLSTQSFFKNTPINQQNSFQFKHRLQVKAVKTKNPQNKALQWFLMVYDQGYSTGLSADNKWAYLYGMSPDGLVPVGFAPFLSGGPALTFVYDFFAFEEGFLVTGKKNQKENYVFAKCELAVNKDTPMGISCGVDLVPSPFSNTHGYLGILNTNQIVEIQLPSNGKEDAYLAVCNIIGEFGESNFVDRNCSQIPASLEHGTDFTISEVEGNVHQILVRYTHADGVYAGYSWHSFDLKMESSHLDDTHSPGVVVLQKDLVVINQKDMGIIREVPAFVYLRASDLCNETSTVKIPVSCKDKNTKTPAISNITTTVLHNINDDVFVSENWAQPNLLVYEGDTFYHALYHEHIKGNGLQISVNFSSFKDFNNYTVPKIMDNERAHVDYVFKKNSPASKPKHIRFLGNYAVGQNADGVVTFYKCNFEDIAAFECAEQWSHTYENSLLMKDVSVVFDNWVFAWLRFPKTESCTALIFDGTNIHAFSFTHAPDSALLIDQGEFASIVMAYQQKGEVYGCKIDPSNPDDCDTYSFGLNQANSGRQHFCPEKVMADPSDKGGLEIYSNCPGIDQRLLRYSYPASPHPITKILSYPLKTTIPINLEHQEVEICSFKTEVVIYASNGNGKNYLKSFSKYNNLNEFTFGTQFDQLDLGNPFQFNCLSSMGSFTVISSNPKDRSTIKLTTYHGDKQYQANSKVYTISTQDLSSYQSFHSFPLKTGILTVLSGTKNPTSPDYLFTFSRMTAIQVKLEHGLVSALSGSPLPLNITFTNKLHSASRLLSIRVVPPVCSAQAETIRKVELTEGEPSKVPLEDNIKITGPVSHAYLEGVGPEEVLLRGRLAFTEPFEACPNTDFDQLASDLDTTVLYQHINGTNEAILYRFIKVQEWAGYENVSLNIHRMAAAQISEERTFVAFSTSDPGKQKIGFLAFKGERIDATSFGNEKFIEDFTKVKVAMTQNTTEYSTFLVAGHNSQDTLVYVYFVNYTYATQGFEHKVVGSIPNTFDFALIKTTTSNTFIFTLDYDNRLKIETHIYDPHGAPIIPNKDTILVDYASLVHKHVTNDKELNYSEEELKRDEKIIYEIASIEAFQSDETGFYLILDTKSILIFELNYPLVQGANIAKPPETYSYFKPKGDMMWDFRGNRENFMMKTINNVQLNDTVVEAIYKRQSTQNGSKYIYWTTNSSRTLPSSLTTCQHNHSHYQTLAFGGALLNFFKIQPMELDIQVPEAASNATFHLVSSSNGQGAGVSFNLTDWVEAKVNPQPSPDESSPWWPYALILGGLVLLAIGFILFKTLANKGEGYFEDNATENYATLPPGSQQEEP